MLATLCEFTIVIINLTLDSTMPLFGRAKVKINHQGGIEPPENPLIKLKNAIELLDKRTEYLGKKIQNENQNALKMVSQNQTKGTTFNLLVTFQRLYRVCEDEICIKCNYKKFLIANSH